MEVVETFDPSAQQKCAAEAKFKGVCIPSYGDETFFWNSIDFSDTRKHGKMILNAIFANSDNTNFCLFLSNLSNSFSL